MYFAVLLLLFNVALFDTLTMGLLLLCVIAFALYAGNMQAESELDPHAHSKTPILKGFCGFKTPL